jgi:hypothetical protein
MSLLREGENMNQSDAQPSANYVTCRCQFCDKGIEFDASTFEKGETRTVPCPHCGLETIIFVPEQKVPPVINAQQHLTNLPVISGIDEDEEIIQQCIEVIRTERKASISLLQRRLRLGYTRAARILYELESRGVVGPSKGAEPRDILVDLDNYKIEKISDSLFQRAQKGDLESQYLLGIAYLNGEGVSQNGAEAFKWVRTAAEHGHAKAQFDMGELYRARGNNHAEAVKWYRMAAKQGNTDAQFALGLIYGFGQGVPKDCVEAVKWYRMAAEQGHLTAQNNLGVAYDHGLGVEKDNAEALKWYRKSADNGDADAQFNLGLSYLRGEGVSEDQTEAGKWFRMAAEQGHANAQFLVGFAHWQGDGVPKDNAEAVKWFRKAAEQGNPKAQFSLGVAYWAGEGVLKDSTEAVKWLHMAAEQGHSDAQCNLGVAYHLGEGVPQNFIEAYKWANLAAAAGLEEAKKVRDDLTQRMTPSQIEEGQRLASIVALKIKNPTNHAPQDRQAREAIPSDVRREVWRRDGGVCVKCGSRRNLEYDHIVPISKGGSNTARNIELLCETCNRSKSASIQ